MGEPRKQVAIDMNAIIIWIGSYAHVLCFRVLGFRVLVLSFRVLSFRVLSFRVLGFRF